MANTIFSSGLRASQPLACRLFEAAIGRGRIANAYLLVGRAAAEKQQLAREIACFLNCQNGTGSAGGSSCIAHGPADAYCLNCQWIAKGEHPQAWLEVAGEGKSQKIPVEKVRQLTEELSKTSSFVRVIFVPQSDEVTFHRPAANALLKSIEEPPPDCLFIFCADSADEVLATIVSRCQVVPLGKPLGLGYWKPSPEVMPAAVQAKLDAARSAFIVNARRQFGSSAAAGNYLKCATDSMELFRQLMDICKELSEAMDESQVALQLLDVVVASEAEVLQEDAAVNPTSTKYLNCVFEIAEKTKRQINQYVKPANALESFSFALNELRHAYSGDISLAKR